jgi:RPA family protein
MSQDGSWHLDKKVPVAIIFAMVGQLLLAVWVMSALYSRVDHIEARTTQLEAHNDEDRRVSALVSRDLGEIKGQLAILISRMQRDQR